MNPVLIISKYPFASIITVLALMALSVGLYYRDVVIGVITYQYWRVFKDKYFQQGYITANDTTLYYEIHGEGPPLVLLHGGLTSMNVYFGQLPALASNHKVITIDLRGQGRSSIGDQLFTYRLLTSDVIAVLDALNVNRADIVGWSDGGIIGLMIAINYPSRIEHLVTIGANFHSTGLTNDIRDTLQNAMPTGEPLLTKLLYQILSPHPERWEELWRRVNLMWLTRPILTIEDINKIETPTLVVVGENDNIELNHTEELAAGIKNAQLVVVADAGHNLLTEKPQLMLDLIKDFIKSASQPKAQST